MARLSLPDPFPVGPRRGQREWPANPGAGPAASCGRCTSARAPSPRAHARGAPPRPRRPDARDVPPRPVPAGPARRAMPRSDRGRGTASRDRRAARGDRDRPAGRGSSPLQFAALRSFGARTSVPTAAVPSGAEPVVSCPNCGNALAADAQLCENCGTPVPKPRARSHRRTTTASRRCTRRSAQATPGRAS